MSKQEYRVLFAAVIRAIFNAINRCEADALRAKLVIECTKTNSKLAAWLEVKLMEGFTLILLPEVHRRLLRTTNGLERANVVQCGN